MSSSTAQKKFSILEALDQRFSSSSSSRSTVTSSSVTSSFNLFVPSPVQLFDWIPSVILSQIWKEIFYKSYGRSSIEWTKPVPFWIGPSVWMTPDPYLLYQTQQDGRHEIQMIHWTEEKTKIVAPRSFLCGFEILLEAAFAHNIRLQHMFLEPISEKSCVVTEQGNRKTFVRALVPLLTSPEK